MDAGEKIEQAQIVKDKGTKFFKVRMSNEMSIVVGCTCSCV